MRTFTHFIIVSGILFLISSCSTDSDNNLTVQDIDKDLVAVLKSQSPTSSLDYFCSLLDQMIFYKAPLPYHIV